MNGKNSREGVIAEINTPLGFFVLALLIVEGFIATAFFSDKLEANDILNCVYLGVGLFVVVLIIVFSLVWHKPQHITFSSSDHINQQMTLIREDLKGLKEDSTFNRNMQNALFSRNQQDYDTAYFHVTQALEVIPNSEEALIEKAVIMSYQSESNFDTPIKLLNQIVEKNPRSGRAYYNLACLKALKDHEQGDKSSDWYIDLRRAIEIDPNFKIQAQTDVDFKAYKNDSIFNEIVH